MDEREAPARQAWYRTLLECTPCTPEYAEMGSMLAHLSSATDVTTPTGGQTP